MRSPVRYLFLFFPSFFFALQGSSQPKFRLSFFHNGRAIDSHVAGRLKFTSLPNAGGLPVMERRGPYLFRIELSKELAGSGAALFIENEHLDTVALYKRQGDSLVFIDRKGNDLETDDNRLGYPEFLLTGGDRTYYLETNFKKDVSLPIWLDTQKGLDRSLRHIFFQLGLYYGACLLFFIFNLLLFIYLSDKTFLYYCFFQFFVVFSIAYADGLLPLIGSWPWLLNHADLPLHIGLAVSGSFFSGAFLEMPRKGYLGRITGGLLLGTILFFTGSALAGNYLLFLAGEVSTFLLLLYFWLVGVSNWRERVHARFFVIGYGVFLLFAIDYFVLRKLGIFLFDWFPGQLKMGSAVETLVLSVAIIARIKVLRDENSHYRQEITKHLQQAAQQLRTSKTDAGELFERTKVKYGLTDRELEVLQGITEGLTNQEIAERIFLSVHTVKFHTRNIFDKLEITNRTQALSRLHESVWVIP